MENNSLNLLTVTADELSRLLQFGSIDSKQIVDACLSQIDKHDDYLRAVISVAPKELLLKQAEVLDQERAEGKIRSRIHGIPILLKVRFYPGMTIVNCSNMLLEGQCCKSPEPWA
jgi:amidase